MESLDCVVIGAGWYGLAAAKQYHIVNPDASLAIIDAGAGLGGTWSLSRLYPGIKSNNLLGTYEYPDFPMDEATYGISKGEHIPGRVINTYLHDYATRFGIRDLIRLNTKVITAEHQEMGGWILSAVGNDGKPTRKIGTRHLILATGLTSEEFLPSFEGQDDFGGKIFHGKHFPQNEDTIQPGNTVTVIGASKLTFDAVYQYAKAGVRVNWIVRASGHGPAWISPPFVTPLKLWIEHLPNIRALSWFSPCIWGDADGYLLVRRFLHNTRIGRALVKCFWAALMHDVVNLNGYDSHEDTAKLKPWIDPMYAGTSFSILNYDCNFWDLVKSDMVKVHVADISHLTRYKVHLSDGAVLPSNAILAHTGWKHVPPIKFLPEGIEVKLGIPHAHGEEQGFHDLVAKADDEILHRLPALRNEPVWNKNYTPLTAQRGIVCLDANTPYTPLTPWMLYRFMVPSSERFLRSRDTAFVGMVSNFSNIITSHIQGLWVSVYLAGKLVRDPAAALGNKDAMRTVQYESVLHSRFGKWRYPVDWGQRPPSFVFDVIPYLDNLLQDLGLNTQRKTGFKEFWSPYMPSDYRGLNDEWDAKFGVGAKLINKKIQ